MLKASVYNRHEQLLGSGHALLASIGLHTYDMLLKLGASRYNEYIGPKLFKYTFKAQHV